MTGELFIVGTPIGNLKDVTYRALFTLRQVDYIASEDTRHTRILLEAHGISKPLISYYREKERESSARIIEILKSGYSVALVTDAGMPCVSDPGAILVSECRNEGIRIESVPGPSAVITALSVSGIRSTGFVFLGFLPDKTGERSKVIERIPTYELPVVIYVAPHDIMEILRLLRSNPRIGRITVAKELTKLHETVIVIEDDIPDFDTRGEFVVISEPKPGANDDSAEAYSALEKLLTEGVKPSVAAKEIAAHYSVPKNALYRHAINFDTRKK